nr:L,D-transpeptidase family protein [Bdellovibrionales bacterium]
MKSNRFFCSLALALTVCVTQFVTWHARADGEVSKTVEKADPIAQTPPEGKLPHALLSLTSDSGAFSPYAFLMDKKSRTLTVWQNNEGRLKLIGAWPADFGRQEGDKFTEGDYKTPEGIYFFQTKMDGRKVDFNQYGVRIFTMDYPNYFDRLEKKTGTGIWLHAIPDTKSLLRGSRGCVVVRNSVIEDLGKFIELKRTPIVVVNAVEYLGEREWTAAREKFAAQLEAWRTTWAGKDLDKYMAQYSERFSSAGMNKTQWREFKKGLGDRYSFIEIGLRDVQIFNQGPKVVFRFLQNYRSDRKEDFGAKILYMLKT